MASSLIPLREYLASRGIGIAGAVPPTAQATVARPPSTPVATEVDDVTRARQAAAAGGSASNLAGQIFSDPTLLAAGRGAAGVAALLRVPGIINSDASDVSKATGTAGAVTNAASQFSRIPAVANAAPAVTSALNSGVTIGTNAAGEAANIPYLSAAGAAFNIANIAQNDGMDDTRKAYEATHQVGRVVADAFVPVGGSMIADTLHMMDDYLVYTPLITGQRYAQVRQREGARLPDVMTAAMNEIRTATTPEELDAALNGPLGGGVQPIMTGDGNVMIHGAHLDTGGAETALNRAYRDQLALIDAAKTDPQAALVLQRLAQQRAVQNQALQTLAGAGVEPVNAATPQARYAYRMRTPQVEDATYETLAGYQQAAEQYRRENSLAGTLPANAGEADKQTALIAQIEQAAGALGLDMTAAAERQRQRGAEQAIAQQSMSSVGDGGGCLLATYSMDAIGLGQDAAQRQFFNRLAKLFIARYPDTGLRQLALYQRVARDIIAKVTAASPAVQSGVQRVIYDQVIAPTGATLDASEVDATRRRLVVLTVALAKKFGIALPVDALERLAQRPKATVARRAA